MKFNFKHTPVALALAALFVTPLAYADVVETPTDGTPSSGEVTLTKDLSYVQDVTVSGTASVIGVITLDASSAALIDDKQSSTLNGVTNTQVTNKADVGASVLKSAKGNIGVNVTAGDNNQQANAAALSAADASFAWGSSDAEVFANQLASGNQTINNGNTNTASLGGASLQDASGNIGVNISAGNSNQQKNDLAASVAVARLATATVKVSQTNTANATANLPIHKEEVQLVNVNLALNASGGYSGSSNGSYSGSQSGTTSGNSYQSTNFYPDQWTANGGIVNGIVHPGGAFLGHADFDGEAQGAVANPTKGVDSNGVQIGGLGFDNVGTFTGSQSGTLGFSESGTQSLSGTVTGQIPVVVAVNLNTTNTSTLSDNVLSNASGNIGLNVATGTNNQQYNGLAISATQVGIPTGSSGESRMR
jgi:hypothetical protein